MDMHMTDHPEEPVPETPEDVAILYSWANLHGAKYRDFSASRREYRAQLRHRAAEELRQAELRAQAEAEAAAAEAERIARDAERAARGTERYESASDRERALREAEEAARRASAERVEAARRAEAAAMAEAAARREEREIAEAHASAQRQAARWNDSEIRRRSLAGPQPVRAPSAPGDPYVVAQGSTVDGYLPTPNEALEYTQPMRYRDEERPVFRQPEPDVRRPRGYRPDQSSGIRPAYVAPPQEPAGRPRGQSPAERLREAGEEAQDLASGGQGQTYNPPPSGPAYDAGPAPAWLYGANAAAAGAGSNPGLRSAGTTGADTLQSSRERVAARWYALKGVFEAGPARAQESQGPQAETRTPVLAIFSLAGGVGKTSMVATLGRALSSLGEKVLLADTTSHGLLPYYFGATELKHGVIRTFSPPSGSVDAPIHLVSYDGEQTGSSPAGQQELAEELTRAAATAQRVLIDMNAPMGWLIRRLGGMNATVLVPVAPDMNSVISLQAVERYFTGAVDADGRPLLPYYVLNQFDASLPLHLDVREVLRRQLADRLLPFVIRRAPAVSEALAEGMTVVDYQPESAVAEDHLNIANWLRGFSAPVSQGFRTIRWSER